VLIIVGDPLTDYLHCCTERCVVPFIAVVCLPDCGPSLWDVQNHERRFLQVIELRSTCSFSICHINDL